MNSKLELDGNKLLHHIPAINRWKQGELVYPIMVEISPVGYCNQKCIFCAYDYLKSQKTVLERERLLEVLDEFAYLGVKSVFFSGEGEPLLHPDLAEFINHTKKKGLECALNTNGIALTKNVGDNILKDLSWIRFSINAGTNESYQRIHRAGKGSFGCILQNLENAVHTKLKNNLGVTLGVQLVYIGQPLEEIQKLVQALKTIGIDYITVKMFNKHPLISFRPEGKMLSYEELRKIEALSEDDFYVLVRQHFSPTENGRTYKRCYGLEFFAELQSDGHFCPCGPLLGISEYNYGNIYKNSFEEIWTGKLRQEILGRMECTINTAECMENCRLNSINNLLWSIKHEPFHVNFI